MFKKIKIIKIYLKILKCCKSIQLTVYLSKRAYTACNILAMFKSTVSSNVTDSHYMIIAGTTYN